MHTYMYMYISTRTLTTAHIKTITNTRHGVTCPRARTARRTARLSKAAAQYSIGRRVLTKTDGTRCKEWVKNNNLESHLQP